MRSSNGTPAICVLNLGKRTLYNSKEGMAKSMNTQEAEISAQEVTIWRTGSGLLHLEVAVMWQEVIGCNWKWVCIIGSDSL